jgi:hypothetical protein
MAEQILKLSPHRDLQCYFLTPSAIAAMSSASDTGFALSGKWRQQFDWAVVEWNRDNTFEHPALRYLPDGDLSGLVLSYEEERTNCIPIESNLVPVVDWSNLRIWATDDQGEEQLYHVDLWPSCATAIQGGYVPASATMTLSSSPGVGKRVGVALLEAHHYYTVGPQDSLEDIAQGIARDVLSNPDFTASSVGRSVVITWKSGPNYGSLLGANGNRISLYGFAEGGAQCWITPGATFSGGAFPDKYRIQVDFGSLRQNQGIPTHRVRKLRWTWAADLQPGSFEQTEFQVKISNWNVFGMGRRYAVAGPGSRRIEDTDSSISYSGSWETQTGNYSGSRIHTTSKAGDSCTITYTEAAAHDLYFGTRMLAQGAKALIVLDGEQLTPFSLDLNGEDVLVRTKLASVPGGSHTLTVTNGGSDPSWLFVDFFEIVYSAETIPDVMPDSRLALATDWDTYHSQSLPPERTAWMINALGFHGRVNHYTGALWFYELVRTGTQYASLALKFSPVVFTGSPTVVLAIAPAQVPGQPPPPATLIKHLVLPDDTVANVVQALAGAINLSTNLVWASANGDQLMVTSRAMGSEGNGISVQLGSTSAGYSVTADSTELNGGIDGFAYNLDMADPLSKTLVAAADYWRTDLAAQPRINRAARDWHQAYFAALKNYGLDCVAAFSTELMNGDPSLDAGIAQRYPDGMPVVLNTPAIQTNFSPASIQFWKQVYLDMARLQANAGITPYLQSGEVQWWYFPKQIWNATAGTNVNVGMPFYDQYTQMQFQAKYGTQMRTITDNGVDPADYQDESSFLPSLIGEYTAAIRSALRTEFPGCRYEVLYPTDTNDTPLNRVINYANGDWTPANLDCLKTESFTFTGSHDLDKCAYSMGFSATKGFGSSARSHLIGIGDAWTAWMKEADLASSEGLESVVLFALDQYCLIGYPLFPFSKSSRSYRQG